MFPTTVLNCSLIGYAILKSSKIDTTSLSFISFLLFVDKNFPLPEVVLIVPLFSVSSLAVIGLLLD